MELTYKGVRPDSTGAVHAWAGKYGKRGALREFIAMALRDASPHALTTVSMITAATQHFGLDFETAAEKLSFRDTVRNGLRQLRDVQGKVEGNDEGVALRTRNALAVV